MKYNFVILAFVLSLLLLFSGCNTLLDKNIENTTDNMIETTAETSEPFTETTEVKEEKPSACPKDFVFPKTDFDYKP